MKKIFIIGGAGFIGSNLARILLDNGYQVCIYDAFLSFIDPFISNYEKILAYRFRDLLGKVSIERGDIRFGRHLSQCLQKHRPDIVVHLAATASAKESSLYPEEAASINSDGLVNVLESLKACEKISRFVYTSSSFVYGNFEYAPADELHPQNPFDIYGASKLAGEVLTKTYCKEYGVAYTIVRPTAVYGFGDTNKRISGIIIENAFRNKPVTLNGGGVSKIDFTYVEDTAMGFFLALSKKEGEDEIFNIACGNGRMVKDYAMIVKGYFPDLELRIEAADLTRPERGSLDIAKARKLLGFNPKYNIEEGIKKYIADYKSFYKL